MTKVTAYLLFNGNCETAFNFYKDVFGGELHIMRYKDMPQSDQPVPDSEKEKVLHLNLDVKGEMLLIGSDCSEAFSPPVKFGDNIALTISPDSEEEARRIFNELSEGGTIQMPFEIAFWGSWYGMFTDKFGISWMVNYDISK